MGQDVTCVVHCLDAAVNEDVVLSVFAFAIVLAVMIVGYFVARILPTSLLVYAPAYVFRDPGRILTTIKRE